VLVVDPSNASTIYAGSRGIFKTTNGGANWSVAGLTGSPIVVLAINHSTPNILYAGISLEGGCAWFQKRLFKSIDGGAHWGTLATNINGCDHIDALVADPANPRTLYMADFDHIFGDTWAPLMKSTDDGDTWAPPSFNPPFACIAVDPREPTTIYAGSFDFPYFGYSGWDDRHGVFKSTDGGKNWNITGLMNMGVNALAIDPLHSSMLYAATSTFSGYPSRPDSFRGLFKSTDGGASWFSISNGLSIGDRPISTIVLNPDNPSVLYAGTAGAGVFKSSDAGSSWTSFNDGLSNLNVRTLVIAQGNPHTIFAGTAGGVFKITDAAAPTNNRIDDARSFVQQHYRDFLSREPDQAGLEFWTNEITSCGSDAECIQAKRTNVSAAFFLSIEFQETGYLVYRMYKTAFGNLAGAPVPVRNNEFMNDTKLVGLDVQVGIDNWSAQLEANKQAYTLAFVQRPEFLAAYPNTLTATDVVTQLDSNAGNVLSTTEKSELVAILGSTPADATKRATVLRSVAENSQLRIAQFNRAFVLMQYFGYLRRNCNDAPDSDFKGYTFWLNKLDSFGGDFVSAEMVKSFIISEEYRQRFGP